MLEIARVTSRRGLSSPKKIFKTHHTKFQMSFPVRCRLRIIVLKQQIRKCLESKEVRFEL